MKRIWSRERVEAHWKKEEGMIDADAAAHFVHPGDLIDGADAHESGSAVMNLQQDLILRVLEWIARGKGPEAWGVRAWVSCYYLRPQLCSGQSVLSYARTRNVTHQAMQSQMKSFRDEFREVDWPSGRARNGRAKTDTSAFTPGGKESLRRPSL